MSTLYRGKRGVHLKPQAHPTGCHDRGTPSRAASYRMICTPPPTDSILDSVPRRPGNDGNTVRAVRPPKPSLRLLGTEPWRAAREYLALKLTRASAPRGTHKHPVIIFPGLATDGKAVAPLRNYCASLGYTAMDWGRGYNTGPQGDVDAWLATLADEISAKLSQFKEPATLIGWSLGGLYARELAKLLGPRVWQVITIGTPFNTARGTSNVAWLFSLLSRRPAAVEPALGKRLRTPPPLPCTSIYSKSDGVVAWQSCTHQRTSAKVQDIEIESSHMGMGWNPAVLRIVADRLAQDPKSWRRYRPAV
ncbi:MAG: hypothetical protein JWP47_937 [Polaromonas sp.]|jgi:pimeloyl-ACP methyl ester carboxylesterase|nr:hypothetical protein [Polaromonas sp.]